MKILSYNGSGNVKKIFLSDVPHFFLKFYLFERDKDSASREGAERERERESQAGSMLPAQSLTQGLNSRNCEIMT